MNKSKRKGISIEAVIIIILSISLVTLVIVFADINITTHEVIELIKGSVTAISSVVVLWIKGSYDKRKIVKKNEEQHTVLYDEINNTNENVSEVTKTVNRIDKEQIVMNEHIIHKNFIKSINIKIERKIMQIIKREINLQGEMQVLLIETGRRIYSVLHDSLEAGFDTFNMEYINIKLIAQAKSLENNINYRNLKVNKTKFKERLKKEVVYPLISEYIRQLNKLILLENGTRRKKLEESTITFVENLTINTIKTAKDTRIKRTSSKKIA